MADQNSSVPESISLIDLVATVWRQKWLVIIITAAAAVLSVLYSLSKPNIYTATSTLLPISGSTSALSQYAGLAAMAGVSLPGASSADPTVKIQAILNSRELATKVINELDLIPKLIKEPEKLKTISPLSAALQTFQKNVFSVSVDTKTSVIKVSAKTKDPELSARIVNTAIDLLQQDLANRVLTASGKNIVVLEQQAAEQEKKVRELQNKMADYQKKNKLIAPQTQSQQGLDLYRSLIQQKITLEIQISSLENTLSTDNPKISQARAQLAAIQKQIEDFEKTGGGVGPAMTETPKALFEYANMQAQLELATKIYGSLLTSIENLRLQDATEKVFVEVIDPAVPPELKSEPARATMCIVGTLAGGFASLLLAFARQALQKLIADPEVRAKFAKKRETNSL
ncbi:MAG TPA: Wzz/FepE/Etk N-terminal domain-containing protein [Rectinema sp.]|nr:Wzz/FepE/Etk N-terminal domain-containing protein [Rectinema sp.]HQJ23067.1 Wzz/FepE/Etk N-terminal domain-containing protein [Rectinema sp.]